MVEVRGDVDHVNGLGGVGGWGDQDQGQESYSKVTSRSNLQCDPVALIP